MEGQTQSLALSKEDETEGFDLLAGKSWIYPTNYPTREYQFNMIQEALLKNTLVSLPTGLGKTFIAAVVMYNFYRWYPHGKIIFMAPTKPLVKQQVEACYNIMAIPPDVTAELTGTKVSSSRANIWLEKRVFFITPQVLQNDLEKLAELGPKIKCLVFDEAHKARGNHAYCQVIRKLLANNQKYFRVLALSATPGCNVNDVAEVAQNLLISHLEFRTEESKDVKPYVFERSLETVVVQLDEKLIQIRDEYLKILEHYAKTLIEFNIIQGNCGALTKGKIFMIMKDFQNKNRGARSSNYSEIMRCLNICVTLYHAFELLIRHGLRNFLSFFDEHIEKPLLRGNTGLRYILEDVRKHLGPIPRIEILPDGTYPEVPTNIKFGHPKHYKLRDILVNHFSSEDKKNTRVIVFFEYRESVMEAHTLLLQSRPLVRPRIFLGQGLGVTQKTQLGVVKAFREGTCNTLLSTCIGEEGLDVGEVDLIVCFDISNKSPIRMVQRMGRTGRKRAGSVLILVTEGREQQTLKDCLIHKNNISTYVLGSKHLKQNLYPDNPRLVPAHLTPRCEKIFITVSEMATKNKSLGKRSSSSSEIIFSQSNEVFEFRDSIPETKMISLAGKSDNVRFFNRHIEKLRTPQRTCFVGHSEHATLLSELLSYADSKRFNIPTKTLGDTKISSGKCLKQGDIRSMFLKENNNKCIVIDEDDDAIDFTQKKPTQDEINETPDSQTHSKLPQDELHKLLSDYVTFDLPNEPKKCSYCSQDFNCDSFTLSDLQLDVINNNIPSEDIINDITLGDIEDFIATLDGSYAKRPKKLDECPEFEDDFDQKALEELFAFEAPKSFTKLAETFIDKANESQQSQQEVAEKALLDFFMLESICDICDTSIEIETSQSTVIYTPDVEVAEKKISLEDLCDLSHFGLDRVQIPDELTCNNVQISPTNSPSLLSSQITTTKPFNTSPPVCRISPTNSPTATKQFNMSPPLFGTPKRKSLKLNRTSVGNESKITITQMIDLFDESSEVESHEVTSNASKSEFHAMREEDMFCGQSPEISKENLNATRVEEEKIMCSPVIGGSKRSGRKNVRRFKLKTRPKYNEFLDIEAEVSEDERLQISEDEDEAFVDAYEKSFVHDATQNFNTEMHAVYLRSIRSPAHRKPLIRKAPLVDIADVYSQLPSTEPNEYVEDSFCVQANEVDLTQQSQLSQLDILERELERRRKRKKMGQTDSGVPKRRRIKCVLSDDSD